MSLLSDNFFYEFRPIPDREYVDAYIKAYYLPDDKLEIWIREHKVGFYLY